MRVLTNLLKLTTFRLFTFFLFKQKQIKGFFLDMHFLVNAIGFHPKTMLHLTAFLFLHIVHF